MRGWRFSKSVSYPSFVHEVRISSVSKLSIDLVAGDQKLTCLSRSDSAIPAAWFRNLLVSLIFDGSCGESVRVNRVKEVRVSEFLSENGCAGSRRIRAAEDWSRGVPCEVMYMIQGREGEGVSI